MHVKVPFSFPYERGHAAVIGLIWRSSIAHIYLFMWRVADFREKFGNILVWRSWSYVLLGWLLQNGLYHSFSIDRCKRRKESVTLFRDVTPVISGYAGKKDECLREEQCLIEAECSLFFPPFGGKMKDSFLFPNKGYLPYILSFRFIIGIYVVHRMTGR